jgi:hypothetical protein
VRAPRTLALLTPALIRGNPMIVRMPMIMMTSSISITVKPFEDRPMLSPANGFSMLNRRASKAD